MKRLSLLAAAVIVCSCATVGREVSEAQIATLKKGETTTVSAMETLGQPTQTKRLSDGRQVLTYSFAHVQTRPETFIPFIGAFVGGADVRSSALVLTFDSSGVLQDWESHQAANASAMGIAGGSYREPDRTLPQEAK